MSSSLRIVFALAVALCAPLAAAQTATITSSVNVRAGPDKAFPTVTWLLTGTSVTVVGCVANWQWCDVIAGRERGWVYSRFLAYAFEGRAITILHGGPKLGLPAIEFSVGPYWDEHFRSKRWYAEKANLQRRWDRQPPPRAWREPRSANREPTALTASDAGAGGREVREGEPGTEMMATCGLSTDAHDQRKDSA